MQVCSCMWMWDMPLVAAECASQAIHNRWWNLASRPALWSFPPPAAACFPRTHLCCWPRVVCVCLCIRDREKERDCVRMSLSLPTSSPRASFHSSICQTWIWKQATFSSLSHHVHIWPQSWWWMSKLSGKAKEWQRTTYDELKPHSALRRGSQFDLFEFFWSIEVV